jgi:WD40 repeat protein
MPDGRWLLQGIEYTGQLRIIGIDGTSELLEKIDDEATKRLGIRTASQSDVFLTYGVGGEERRIGLWSAPERRLLAQHLYESVRGLTSVMVSSSQQRALLLILENGKFNIDVLTFDGEYKRLGTVDLDSEQDGARSVDAAIDLPDSVDVNRQIVFAFDRPEGRSIWASTGHTIFEIGIGETGLSEPRFFGKQESAIRRIANDRAGRFLATLDVDGQILIWSLDGSFPPKTLPIPSGAQSPKFVSLGFTDDGSAVAYSRPEAGPVRWIWSLAGDEPRLLRRLEVGEKGEAYSASNFATTRRFARTGPDAKTRIWSYRAPFDVEPLILQHGSGDQGSQTRFEPAGRWLATAGKGGLRMWPMVRPYPMVIQKHKATIYGLTFGPDGRWLASSAWDNTVRLWPLDGDVPPPGRVLFELPPEKCCKLCELAVSPDGRQFLVGTESGGVWHFSMQGQESVRMPGFESGTPGVAFSPDGTFAAAIGGNYDATEAVIRVWDVPTWEEMAVLTPPTPPFQWPLQATEGGHIFSAGNSGLLRWSLAAGTNELVYEGAMGPFAATTDGRRVLAVEKNDSNDPEGSPVFLDFDTGDVTRLTSHGDRVIAVALDSTGTVAVSGDQVGEVRVGPVTGEEPHLLLGHEGPIYAIAVDPLGRWIASAGQDKTIRLWPMPDFSKPPLHTLPREELIAKLETLTNLRVVRDEESSTGWKLTHDPFPGWAEVPTW